MAKPNNLFAWATAPGSTLEPGTGEKAAGLAAGDKIPARWINWLSNGAHQWFQYLSNLHGEAEFLNKDYPWTGQHAHSGGITVNGGVDLNSTSRLIGSLEMTYATTRQRAVAVPLHSGSGCIDYGTDQYAGPGAFGGDPHGIITLYNGSTPPSVSPAWFLPISWPEGGTLRAWHAVVDPDASNGVTAELVKRTVDYSATLAPTTSVVSSDTTSGGSRQLLSDITLEEVNTGAANDYFLVFRQGGAEAITAQIHAVQIIYDENRATGSH